MPPPGVIIAAPASGSGKTLITMGLLRCLTKRGVLVEPAKLGPDYIDPAFHARASGRECLNLDSWAMRPSTLAHLVRSPRVDLVLAEGVMGLFDGALVGGRLDVGSTADVAKLTGWPIVLVVNARGQGASVGALLHGFATLQDDVALAGIIFNHVGSGRHLKILSDAAKAAAPDVLVLGALAHDGSLHIGSRHLGLQQAAERDDLEPLLDRLAERIGQNIDLDGLLALARPSRLPHEDSDDVPIAPLGQRIAVARDTAFSFTYPHLLNGWRNAGAMVSFFSPLANEPPPPDADAVYLPGGYPELHAGRLAGNSCFMDGLRQAAARGATVYGECGGYIVLGRSLTDQKGRVHHMAGLLPLETSFAQRALHLGYRQATLAADCALGAAGARYLGHEFHYISVINEGPGARLFDVADAGGTSVGTGGLQAGSVMGSFVHLIDAAEETQ